MHRQDIVESLNRAAAEVEGWQFFTPQETFPDKPAEWDNPRNAVNISPEGVRGFASWNKPPDYCSENVPHARLVGLLRKVKEAKRGQEWGKFLSKCVWPKADNNSPFWHTEVLDCVAATPLFIVAACLVALDKLPVDITLGMIRGLEAGETCNEDRDASMGEEG